ncbi:hypothetical protein DFH11DRAFT_1502092 [Phellopilus nigrolimitatus]|nr:hypothetical protein DFH11DRAFT_1502092 [Phellopilus nigrolimitatus]
MVQCETCMAWQHGPCMGFAEENEIPEGDYYCERCKPEDHVELLKKLQRRQRQSSEKSLHTHQSRNSRSHSPTHFLKTAKRRNTMNSRDAAYDERIQELLDATAAATTPDGETAGKDRAGSVAKTEEIFEDISEIGPGGRKKRKRVDDDALSAKRKRSTSVISERVISAATAADKLDIPAQVTTVLLPPPPAPTSNKSRVRRAGGRKSAAAQEVSVNGDGEEDVIGATTKKHPNQYTYRVKPGTNAHSRRAPQSTVGQHQQNAVTHDHGTRRNAGNANNPGGAPGSGSRGAHNAYYNNMQLPMFTSWNLPDYLAHLQSILPSDMPPPLQIRGATSFFREDVRAGSPGAGSADNAGAGSGEIADTQSEKMASALANATESLTERGVKVKWPAKRMSVADMNKRVRALVEWVGREQALALDRERRKAALETALRAHQQQHTVSAAEEGRRDGTVESPVGSNTSMMVDGASPSRNAHSGKAGSQLRLHALGPDSTVPRPPFMFGLALGASTRPSTTKMMEELMRELISFQERFGPGAKGAAKERTGRTALS